MSEYFEQGSGTISHKLIQAMQSIEENKGEKNRNNRKLRPDKARDVEIFTRLQRGFHYFDQGRYNEFLDMCLPVCNDCISSNPSGNGYQLSAIILDTNEMDNQGPKLIKTVLSNNQSDDVFLHMLFIFI